MKKTLDFGLYYMLVRMLQKMKKDLMFGNFVMN